MDSKAMTVFAVDDDESELELLSRILEEVPNIDFEVHSYTDPDLALIEFMNHDAELIFLDRLWPDFDRRDLWAAVSQYATRERRFGSA